MGLGVAAPRATGVDLERHLATWNHVLTGAGEFETGPRLPVVDRRFDHERIVADPHDRASLSHLDAEPRIEGGSIVTGPSDVVAQRDEWVSILEGASNRRDVLPSEPGGKIPCRLGNCCSSSTAPRRAEGEDLYCAQRVGPTRAHVIAGLEHCGVCSCGEVVDASVPGDAHRVRDRDDLVVVVKQKELQFRALFEGRGETCVPDRVLQQEVGKATCVGPIERVEERRVVSQASYPQRHVTAPPLTSFSAKHGENVDVVLRFKQYNPRMITDQAFLGPNGWRRSSYLTESEQAALQRPTASARGLPSRTYTDPELFTLELETVFRRNWMGVALSCRVDGAGDVLPVEVAGLPIVLVRADDGVLRAFHNVSVYDACLVALAPLRRTERLRGPYHGFEWDHRGRLLRTPYFDGSPDSDPRLLPASGDLCEISCGEWSGLVFVCIDEPQESLLDHLAPVLERMAVLSLEQLAPCRTSDGEVFVSTTAVPGNWKIAFENDVEVLHEAFVHSFYAKSPFAPKVDASGRRTFTPIADRGLYGLGAPVGHYYDDADPQRLPLIPVAAGRQLPEVLIADLFPNVQVGLMPDHYTVGFHLPLTVDSTLNEIVLFAHADVAAQGAVTERLAVLWDETRAEDDVVVAATQAGRRSIAVTSTFYAEFWDGLVHEFHKHVAREVLRP